MTKIIAEIGLSHEGSLGNAISFVVIAKDCGADAVKFQHHTEGESTPEHTFREGHQQDFDRNEYWKRTGFNRTEWQWLIHYAKRYHIKIGISTFTIEGWNQIADLGWDFFKVPSGEWENHEMIEAMCTCKPFRDVHMSLGMWDQRRQLPFFGNLKFMRCDSGYPSKLEDLDIFSGNGYSDHSGTPWPSMYAIAQGSYAVEVHLCMHKDQFGPDINSSVDPSELRQIVKFRDAVKKMRKPFGDLNKLRAERYAEYRKCKSRFSQPVG
jgi:N,N'-diacetyllegionaminate synthase